MGIAMPSGSRGFLMFGEYSNVEADGLRRIKD
jgi:hypothetical protein